MEKCNCNPAAGGWPEKANLIHCHNNINNKNRLPFILPWPCPSYYVSASSSSLANINSNIHHHHHHNGFIIPSSPATMTSLNQGAVLIAAAEKEEEEEEEEKEEDPAAAAPTMSAASRESHSQAEKRRRERINTQLSTLRRLIPHSHKMDKAALLGSVVDHVKELKRKVVEIADRRYFNIPTEFDQVTVIDCSSNSDDNNNNDKDINDVLMIKASVCCEDRPELLKDVIRALKGLKLKTVRADMVTVGGRVLINVLTVLCSNTDDHRQQSSSNSNSNSSSSSSSSSRGHDLKKSLKVVLNRVLISTSSSTLSSNNFGFSRKRQRILFPSH